MRLLVRTHARGWRGGLETFLGAILPALAREGFELGLAYAEEARAGEATVDRDVPGIPLWHTQERRAALEGIAAWRPDVVMENDGIDWELGRTLATAYPAVSFVHVHTGTCISGSKMRALPTPVPCQRVLGAACLALYLPCRCGGLNPVAGVKNYLGAKEKQTTLRAYRKLLVASEWMKADLVRHGFEPRGVSVLPLFADAGALPALPPTPGRSGEILMLSRLSAAKGGDVLIRAIPLASQKLGRTLRLVMAGNGPALPALRELATRLRVPVEFKESLFLPPPQRQELMRNAELLALPSLWPEPFGLVGLEAGAVGLPTVAFASGGPMDWCIPGETGELAPADPPTAEGLAAAIARALGDRARYEKIREGAFAMAQRMSLDRFVGNLVSELRSAVGRA